MLQLLLWPVGDSFQPGKAPGHRSLRLRPGGPVAGVHSLRQAAPCGPCASHVPAQAETEAASAEEGEVGGLSVGQRS